MSARVRIVFGVLAALLLALPRAAAQESPPNVLLVVLDDLDVSAPGCYGSTIRTPTIDDLAARGVRFTRAYAAAPLCSASRVGLWTGSSPARLGIHGLIPEGSLRGIPGPVPTIADDFRAAGYRTACIGKWHAGAERPEHTPLAHGFDTWTRSERRGGPTSDGRVNRYVDFDLIHDEGERQPFVNGEHLTAALTDRALAWLEREPERPFFVCLSYLAPHAEYYPPEDFDNARTNYDLTTDGGRYAAMVTNADRQLARVVSALEAGGRAENTLIVVTSDHGGLAKVQQHPARPVRGTKGRLGEGGLRIPLVACWPRRIPAGVVNDSVVGLIDLRPTFAALLGAPATDVEGQSFLAALGSNAHVARERPLVFEQRRARADGPHVREAFNAWAVIDGRWKLSLPRLHPSRPKADVSPRLFDLVADPLEQEDVAARELEVVERLERAHRAWRLEGPRVPYELEPLPAGVEERAAGLRFAAGSDGVALSTDSRIDVLDGGLSLVVDVRPDAPALEGTSVIAERRGCWELGTSAGRVRVRLFRGAETVTLEGPVLAAGEHRQVALTVLDWFTGPQRVRLYVDGEVVAERQAPAEGVAAEEPIRLGGRGFVGWIGRPRVALVAWTTAEVRSWSEPRGVDAAPVHETTR